MTHLGWKEVAEGLQARTEERCAVDGHTWTEIPIEPPIEACRWCQAVRHDDDSSRPDWRRQAVDHATVVRALLSVREHEPESNGARWLEAARITIRLDDAARREGIEIPGAIVSARP